MPPSPSPDTCWLYLIRHAATSNNRARPPRLQGRRTDPGLSDEGYQQAERTGRWLADVPIDAVYSSPLLRARQTAAVVAQPHGVPVAVVEDLMEVDVGDWEGRSWDEIERNDREAYQRFIADASVHPYRGGENLSVVRARAVPAFEQLLTDNAGRIIAAVAHNVVNRTYLAHLLDVPLRNYRLVPQDNCGANLIRHRNGKTKLVTINAVRHLADGD